MKDIREHFEAWASEECRWPYWDSEKNADGGYEDDYTDIKWQAYREGYKAAHEADEYNKQQGD